MVKALKIIMAVALLSGCYKATPPIVKECRGDWGEEHTPLSSWIPTTPNYTWESVEIPFAGSGHIDFNANLTEAGVESGSQGPRWEFISSEGEFVYDNLSTYYSFYDEETVYYSSWLTDHTLTFPSAGTLWVQKYNYFTTQEKFCVYYTVDGDLVAFSN